MVAKPSGIDPNAVNDNNSFVFGDNNTINTIASVAASLGKFN